MSGFDVENRPVMGCEYGAVGHDPPEQIQEGRPPLFNRRCTGVRTAQNYPTRRRQPVLRLQPKCASRARLHTLRLEFGQTLPAKVMRRWASSFRQAVRQACPSKIDQRRRLYFRISEGHSLVDASVSLTYALARPCSTQEACCVLAGG